MLVGEAPDGVTINIVAMEHGDDHYHFTLQADIAIPAIPDGSKTLLDESIKRSMQQASLVFGSHHEPVIWKDETTLVQSMIDQLPDNGEGDFLVPGNPLPPHTVQM